VSRRASGFDADSQSLEELRTMRKALVLLFIALSLGYSVAAQEKAKAKPEPEAPTLEIGGGYTFLDYYAVSGGSGIKMNGWNATADYTILKRWLSVAIDANGAYKNTGLNGKYSLYTLMAGPRFYPFGHRKFTPYGHFLFGDGYLRFTIPAQGGFPSTTQTSNAYAWAAGGGADVRWKQNWSIRIFQFDYVSTRFFNASPSQGNYKISVGVLYRFGSR
jgi:hypothetical protein